ncbi:MAG: N-acetylmuramoyl-L-alanine amidase [Acidimicrobiaceae bacterium]|nr:N-acetylmuramoyl-L-alanine amidase [Acidimicrobiaceae bacterium]
MKHRYRALPLVIALTGFAVACASDGGGDELSRNDTTTTAAPRTTANDATITATPETTDVDDATTTTSPRTTADEPATTTPETTVADETGTTTTAPRTTVDPTATAPRTTVDTTTTSAPRSSIPQRGTDSGLPPGLITPTGIPVAVTGRTDSGYLVRTPCGHTAEVSKGVFINGARVVIDPGHGGPVDTGAIGPNGLVERDLNLTLSRAVLDELAGRGISAVSTRTGDYGTLLSVRAALADDLEADALVSIHHNAPTWAISEFPGSEVFIQSESISLPRADSARLGGLLYEEITTALASFDNVAWSRAANAGVLRVLSSSGTDAYGMIVRPTVPAVLVEYGYLSNPSEAALFATDEYIRVAAIATADAIDAYLRTDRSGTGFVDRPRIFDPRRAPSFCEDPALE